MSIFRTTAAALVLAVIFSGTALAQERGTADEAKAMVDAALDHIKKVGAERAYKDFTVDKANWNKKDLYVMVYDGKGIALAHGANDKLIGKDMTSIKDGNGKPVVPGLLELVKKGGGWFDYDWPDPLTKKMAAKSTYGKALPGGDGFVGVGIYR